VLDLASLLTGVPVGPTAADLDPYLDFGFAGGDTTVTIDFDGGGVGTDAATVTLQDVDLSGVGSDEDIIGNLMTNANLMAA
jgi:hypothetical protein